MGLFPTTNGEGSEEAISFEATAASQPTLDLSAAAPLEQSFLGITIRYNRDNNGKLHPTITFGRIENGATPSQPEP